MGLSPAAAQARTRLSGDNCSPNMLGAVTTCADKVGIPLDESLDQVVPASQIVERLTLPVDQPQRAPAELTDPMANSPDAQVTAHSLLETEPELGKLTEKISSSAAMTTNHPPSPSLSTSNVSESVSSQSNFTSVLKVTCCLLSGRQRSMNFPQCRPSHSAELHVRVQVYSLQMHG
jgi:hypothetical protein